MMPVKLHGGSGKEEGAAEIGWRKPGFTDGFFRCQISQSVGEGARTLVALGQEIDRASDGGCKMISRETGDAVDAGAPIGERRPVVLFALAKRRDDAHAGDCHQGPAEAVGCLHGHFFLPYRISPKSAPLLGSTMRSLHTIAHFSSVPHECRVLQASVTR